MNSPKDPIAIVGIGCRFPGCANDPEGFWRNLEEGADAIVEIPPDRWNLKGYYDPEAGRPGKTPTRWGGFIVGIDQFDPHFFGISPREASRMDPQQRLLLELAWEALEDGGQVLERLSGSQTAVFVGIASWDYSLLQTSFRDRAAIDVYSNTGGSLSIAANRISYCFDFRGPSAAVDTACSSSLVAVHLACRSIWEEGCPLALAGGVNALLMPDWYIGFSRLGMLSPDGRCRAFDARANGYVRSEGCGLVILKPMARALADGDRIYAVIRGTVVNQDGHTPGMTVPSQEAQEALLRRAFREAGVAPAAIQYVEAHGTGTPVGDPIEVRALGRVLSTGRPTGRPCLVGSVKTNIGHLEAGSGIAGLIKAALALHHRRIPGNLHLTQPNPEIDFERLHLRVPLGCEPWPDGDGPALAAVNSFGYGGTNAHVVLQEAPAPAEDGDRRIGGDRNGKTHDPAAVVMPPAFLVPLSARGPEALHAAAGALKEFLATCPVEVGLRDIAGNAALRRSQHEHRLAVVAHSKPELAEQLEAFVAGQPVPSASSGRAVAGRVPKLAFVCSGQGPQWWAMGRQLLDQEPVFRDAIGRCDAIVRRLGPWSLRDELTADEARSRMDVTAIAQPAIFALQVALAALWRSWGVRPDAVIGHSVGEVAAAHLAGVFDLDDAMRVIYHRGRCMERTPVRGRMLAAGVGLDEARRLVAPYGDRVSVAAVNSPTSVTLSGEAGPLEEIARSLEGREVFCRFLQVQYAFHSAQMDPARDELLAALDGVRPQPAMLPFGSTVTGRRVSGPELGPSYWWQNVRQMVRFVDGVDFLIATGCDAVLELGPHPVLGLAVADCYRHRSKDVGPLPSLRRHEEERATMLRSLGALHAHGYPIDWSGVLPGPHRFVRLPSYPWQHQRCWSESEESRVTRLTAPAHPLLGRPLGSPRPSWETRFDLRLSPYLGDHRVQRAVIVPATTYIEIAFAVAREVFDLTACQLEDVKLANPCFPPQDGALRLHTAFQRDDATVQVHSRVVDKDQDWTAHFAAVLRPRQPDAATEAFRPEAIQRRCPRTFTRAECYDNFQKMGLDYGPLFQGIERGWKGDREALGFICLPDGRDAQEDGSLFHPALLDSCLQVVIPADRDFGTGLGGLYLPVEIEQVRLYRRPGPRLWSHALLREKAVRWTLADLDIYDEDGQLVAQFRGLRSRRVAEGSDGEALDDLLYAYEWRLQPLPPLDAIGVAARDEPRLAPTIPGHWLLFADRGGVGDRLAESLRTAGEGCTLVRIGADFGCPGEDRYEVDPGRNEDMVRLLRAVAGPDRSVIRGIVHLWNLDAPPAEGLSTADLEAAQGAGLLSVLHLVQAWDEAGGAQVPRLVLVTRGAQSVGEEPERIAVAQGPLIGLGRVIISEYTRMRCKLVDLDPSSADTGIRSLYNELWATDDEDEIALRGPGRYVHRLMPSSGRAPGTGRGRGDGPYRLVVSQRPGSLEGLTLQDARRRPPKRGEVEIEVVAAGLNFSDVMKALGLYPGLPGGPVPLGAECSGRITALGEGVPGLRIGDEVVAVAPCALGSHVTTRAEFAAPKPTRISFEEAATLPIAFLTASYALDNLGHLGAGERVLIHSAAGGVGLAAVQLARRAGAEVFTTAGTPEKRDFLRGLGVEHVLDSRTLAFADEVLERTGGRGVNVVLNSLAGEAIARSLATLADYGRFLEIGRRDIYQNTRLGLAPFRKNLSFFAIDLDRMMHDRPAVLGALLREVVQGVQDGRLAPLPHRVFPIADVVGAFRFMQQSKHIGKIVLSLEDRPESIAPGDDEPVDFRADASYLITGGLGGFGLAVARWLVEHGARHLVLVGRRGVASPEARQVVADLEGLGARVAVLRADVSREDDVAAVLTEIDRSLPPLRGVLHAAMVLEDSTLLNLDDDLMRRVIAPKMNGAWNLHTQTLGRPLDVFVLFSSLTSVFGHAGQGNYAAANAFLDALAHHRRALGLPGVAINWGYLGEVGYLAQKHQLGERLERQGVQSFTVRQALALLERAIQRQAIQVSVMRVDWSRWRGLGVTGRVSPRFAHLLREPGAGAGADRDRNLSTLDAVRSAAPGERPGLLDTLLRDKVARVLGASPAGLDGERSLLNLGLDSLMAVELRNWIESELRVNLPIVELMRSPGLSHLTGLLLERLTPADGALDPTPTGSTDGDSALTPLPSVFPLAHGQRGLWFLQQMDRASAAYNLCFPCRIRSRLDLPALRRALQALVNRHPSLRTTFEERDGELLQRVHDEMPVWLEALDASSWDEDVLRRRLDKEAHRPFDLERGPLFRVFLFSGAPDDHVLHVTAHHLVGDYWSLVVVLEEIRALYPAECSGTPPSLSPVSGHYRDFVRWQDDLLAGPDGERLWSYWAGQLAGVTPVLELPTDRPRPPAFTHRGADCPCRISADLTRRLRALAATEHVTLYTVLLATFQAILGRYTGQEDLVVGSPFACRSRPEFERIVGTFINMLPLRADLSGDPTFRELLRRLGSTVRDALQHQDYPFPLLVERLNLRRDPGRTPLAQATFTMERAQRASEAGTFRFFHAQSESRRDLGGLQTEPYRVEQRTCQSDLELVLEEGDGTIEGVLRYNTDLFDADTIQRMLGHFLTLLEGATAEPDRRLSELPWLTGAEQRQVVREWNATSADVPQGVCLHEWFEQQVRRTPEAVALCAGERTLRYAELDAWANRIAHRLHRLGVGPDTPVALCLERSPELVAAILATLKAGGAYVPLDPVGPAPRLRVILEDTRAPVLLTRRDLLGQLPGLKTAVICLDENEAGQESGDDGAPDPAALPAGEEAARPPASGVGPGNLAYIIYTSGSTGRPKGVMVEHRAIGNTVLWRQRALALGAGDRVLLNFPYSFDPSICLIFPALAAGAELILAEPGEERDPSRLIRRIARDGVTVLQALPSVLGLLLDCPSIGDCRTVRVACCGGEAMPTELPGQLFDLLDADLYNLYGPTEAAVEATWWECRRGETRPVVPIGRPIANARAYALDRSGRPVPAGVPGELYLGGAGLARGYLNDPRRTAERFVPDPFGGAPGARLYRTGDRCRWLADGSIEFLGRLDRQVKVRGYRIEPGEIEVALASAPEVGEAAVTVHTDEAGERCLVAYVAARDGAEPPPVDRLRRHLRERLPESMVPSAFVMLPALPRTPTGKLDRGALPAPSGGPSRAGRSLVAPRTPLEEFLVGLWREVLRVEQLGVEDNFFELGGNSIQGAVLINRLQEKLGRHINTVALFDSPTVADLARYLGAADPGLIGRLFGPESLPRSTAKGDGDGEPAWRLGEFAVGMAQSYGLLVPLQPDGPVAEPEETRSPRTPLFLVHPPGGIVVCYRPLAYHLGREWPLYAIRARGLYGEQDLPTRLEDMAADYLAALREVRPEGPYHLGGWSLGGVVALEMAQQLIDQGERVGLLAFLDTTIPFGRANRDYLEGLDQSGREYGLDLTLEELARLGPDEQLPLFWWHVQKLGIVEADTPLPLVQQLLDDLKRLFHSHVQLVGDYVVRPYPGRITLFRPSESPLVIATPADRGWSRLADAVDVHFVPGQHHTMVKEPHVQVLAQQLRACFRRAEEFRSLPRRTGHPAR